MTGVFNWAAEKINDFMNWLATMAAEEIARQLKEFVFETMGPGITQTIAVYANSIETVLLSVLLAPLFLINMITASVDIFAGITPIYQTDGNNAVALYAASPRPIYMIDKNSTQKIPLFSDIDLLPPFPYGPEVDSAEDPALISVRDKVQETWRRLIQSNPDVVMNETLGSGNPKRYYPHVRAFVQENNLGFGTDSMYQALANAMLCGAAVGTGVRAENLPQMEQIPLDILLKSEQMPKRLVRPFVPYNDENFLLVEAAAVQGLYVPESPYITELALDEDLEEITLARGRYLKISGYEIVSTETVEVVGEEGELVTETVTVITYMNTYLHREYYNAYNTLFKELMESGWVTPQAFVQRLAALRDNPGAENNEELARLLGLTIVSGEVVAQMYAKGNPYLWTNEYVLTADFVAGAEFRSGGETETDAPAVVKGEDTVRYFAAPAEGYGLSFYARYDSELQAMTEFTAIDSFYTAKALWVDFMQNNADIVYNPLRSYDDIERYTPAIKEFIHNAGVEPGSEEMHELLAQALYSFDLAVSDKPVNLWVDPDYVLAYRLKERPENTYYSTNLKVTNDITLPERILNSETVRLAFWGITLISMVLCLIFSIYAVTSSMGDLTLQRPVGKVMGLTAKSMLIFLIMPAFCVCAVYLSGVVLAQINYLIDSGGESGEPVSVTGAMFYAAVTPDAVLLPGEKSTLLSVEVTQKGDLVTKKKDTPEIRLARIQQYEYLHKRYLNGTKSISILDIFAVKRDFDTIKLVSNGFLIMMSLAAWVLLVLMIMVLIVFLRRIFDIVMLYLTAPLFASTIPLDDGQVFGGWREKFIGAVVMGFGSLVTFKLLVLLLPLIWAPELTMHPGTVVNNILKVILTLGGVFATYKSHTLIASMLSQYAEEAESGAMAVTMEPANQAKQLVNTVKNQISMGVRQLTHKGLDKLTGNESGAGSQHQSYLYQSRDRSSESTTRTQENKTTEEKADTEHENHEDGGSEGQ